MKAPGFWRNTPEVQHLHIFLVPYGVDRIHLWQSGLNYILGYKPNNLRFCEGIISEMVTVVLKGTTLNYKALSLPGKR